MKANIRMLRKIPPKFLKILHFIFVVVGLKVMLVLLVRLLMPYVAEMIIQREFNGIKEYNVKFEDLNIYLHRGAYVIKNLSINERKNRRNSQDSIPLLVIPSIDLSIDWKMVKKGVFYGKINVEFPVLTITSRNDKDNIGLDSNGIRHIISYIMPLKVNRLEVHNGQMQFLGFENNHPEISVTNIFVKATNLQEVINKGDSFPGQIHITASAYDGIVDANIHFDPKKTEPTFELQSELKDINLEAMNTLIKKYGHIEDQTGHLTLYTELQGKQGYFEGYVKPSNFSLHALNRNIQRKEKGGKIDSKSLSASYRWENHNASASESSKIIIEGKFTEPGLNFWIAVSSIIQNVFTETFVPMNESQKSE